MSPPVPGRSDARRVTAIALFAAAAAWGAWRTSAWVTDDAWFCFRTVEQAVAGRGLRWNPHDRVQVFTDPLWVLLLVPLRAAGLPSPEAARLASLALTTVALALVAGRTARRSPEAGLAWVALFLASRTLVDWTASGLETPLGLLLLALAFGPGGPTSLRGVALGTALLGVHRLDAVLLGLPALLLVGLRALRDRGPAAAARDLALGLTPLVAWLAYATVWFGTPLPNPWFAKVANGVPFAEKAHAGAAYVALTLRSDPVAAGLLVAAAVVALLAPGDRARRVAAVAGAAIALAYTVAVGGDYMLGRFVDPALILATLALVDGLADLPRRVTRIGLAVGVIVALASVAVPGSLADRVVHGTLGPVLPLTHGVYDEAGLDRLPIQADRWSGTPYRPNVDRGILLTDAAGETGFRAGLDVDVVDTFAIGDPLLARLPARSDAPGHHDRVVPDGYLDALRGHGTLADPQLAAFDADLRLLTRGPLFTAARWRAIVRLLLSAPLAPSPDRQVEWGWHALQRTDGVTASWCVAAAPGALGAVKRTGHDTRQPDVLHAGHACPVRLDPLPPGDPLELSLSAGPWHWAWMADRRVVEEGSLEVEGAEGTLVTVGLPRPPEADWLWLKGDRGDAAIGHLRTAGH